MPAFSSGGGDVGAGPHIPTARLFVLFHTTRKHITRHHTGSSIACYQKSRAKKCNVAEKRGALF